ncbi:urea carboxylase [Cellulosimicrobium protaetiae]|uniref:Urea carboxylase n=1 Tax=Cellulosimicrobium protaetiae TaxID=2587808 RepID=A0A6M5UIH0_9MICO|nr:urea carboxylase [Cellulosimicrobium protaetiae]QJW38276.1 urea carboxylase [Cellulosimicrobium protaetiae]
MFDTVLVANRGEIACRLLRGARELGIRTVAVYSEADAGAPHVRLADEAVLLGPAPAASSYLDARAVLDAARRTGAGAIHPGYGFLSENAGFAAEVEAAGLAFVGPTPEQIRVFGDKASARDAARACGVPLVAGTGVLDGVDDAVAQAAVIGYPVMLKAVGGGGGIGMQACQDPDELAAAYRRVERLAAASFGSGGVFLERFVSRARHLEVQVFGDGQGRVVSLGDRDCSLQRRHQKVVEEAPAPGLPDAARAALHAGARDLAASVGYRSAGTVEYVYDVERDELSFLEVNTRLQVEHPVTEAVTRVDLVHWMLRLARGETVLDGVPDAGPAVRGHAVEARVYAEDPRRDHRPSAGLLTRVELPTGGARVDTWVEAGQEVTTHYDPLLAKVVVHEQDRTAALDALGVALQASHLVGVQTNLPLLRAVAADPVVRADEHTTGTLAHVRDDEPWIDVLAPGVMTTVQDWPGRLGHWDVGISPSGPMDDLAFREGNRALGNPEGAPGLECTLTGPRLRFSHEALVCVTGAPAPVTLDGRPVPQWEPVEVAAGAVLDVGAPHDAGLRTYVLVRGGLDVPEYLGSASTFTLGGFGGYTGRALAPGDVLVPGTTPAVAAPGPVPEERRPVLTHTWELAVQEGPQPAPSYFTPADMAQLYTTTWDVQSHANRTGIRLSGPAPTWARPDGGDAGLHPSNLHDNPYSVGALNVSGDTPILLGPDGPSLGGFACPVTVVAGARWKLGQIRPGDTVRFVPVSDDGARRLRNDPLTKAHGPVRGALRAVPSDDGVLGRRPGDDRRPAVSYLRGGDDNVLVEYGDAVLDLGVRLRVHALARALRAAAPGGVVDVTPGVRSLHVHVDPDVLPVDRLAGLLAELEEDLPAADELVVPSRRIHLPLSWDDPSIREAVDRYAAGVRPTAPWLPSNVEFIRRINGLASVEDVRRTVLDAEYLVLGLGDVYLGAPLAVPLDPRHRLVTTKYNPARTWTPSDAVGLGGTYLCVYGMESPGGYQLVGRTVPIWSGHRQRGVFETGVPWLLRFFDRIVWEPVGADELVEQRAAFAAGRLDVRVEDGEFSLRDHLAFLEAEREDIEAFRARQADAFAAERAAWERSGELDRTRTGPAPEPGPGTADGAGLEVPDGHHVVHAPMVGSVWRVAVGHDQQVEAGDELLVLEAMKLELRVTSPVAGRVARLLVEPGQQVTPGTALALVAP